MSVVLAVDCRAMMMISHTSSSCSLDMLDREVCCISVTIATITTTVVKQLTVKVMMMIALLIDAIG